jgi:pimeloyl-ACP methyl ester carboxylesterase
MAQIYHIGLVIEPVVVYGSVNRPSIVLEGTGDAEGGLVSATLSETVQPQFRSYSECPNKMVSAANGVDYAFRELGDGAVPLVLLQHFRGNLDYWDPALIDALAVSRRVIAFDNAGVGRSSGTTPSTVTQMARDAIAFLAAIDLDQVDVLGYSLGSFVAQEIALIRPELVRRIVLASSAPEGAAGMHGWAPEVIDAVGKPDPDPDDYLRVFFAASATSQRAGQEVLQRMFSRTTDADEPTNWHTRQQQYDAVCAWGEPNHSLLQRLSAIDRPVFIANGDSDPMILPRYTYLLAGLIRRATVKIYPDAAHGFLFQHHAEFATDVDRFLTEASAGSSISGASVAPYPKETT